MAEAARAHGAERVVAVLDAGRGEAVCERFALEADRARSLGPAALVRVEDVAGFAAGDRLVDLKDERDGSAAAALAAAVSRRPRQADAAGASPAIYSRPSAAEEKRGAP
jgi:tRNA A37 threonylcarbamoyladenosine modification protein TsaB